MKEKVDMNCCITGSVRPNVDTSVDWALRPSIHPSVHSYFFPSIGLWVTQFVKRVENLKFFNELGTLGEPSP